MMAVSSIRAARALGALAALTCCTAVLAQPANDACGVNAAAHTIPPAGGSISGDTTSATRDGDACAGAGGVDIYYYWTPNFTGPVRLTTCNGATYDTVLSLHTNTCPVSAATSIGCNDDSCGLQSNFQASVTAGTQYIVRMASYGATTGPFTFTVTPVVALTNDECGATNPAITVGTPINGDTTGATTTLTITPNTVCGPAGAAGGANDIFYRFTPPATGAYTFSLCDSTFDTVISVHSACPVDSVNVVGCNDDSTATATCTSSGLHSLLPSLPLTAGQTYVVRVGGYNGATGAFTLLVTSGGPATGACCAQSGACTATVSTACGAPSVYLGDNVACTPTACPSSGSCCTTAGDCTSTFQANCTAVWTSGAVCTPNPCPQPPAPTNDDCLNAATLSVGGAAVAGTCYGSTQSTTATCTGSTRDVWYQFTSATSQTVRVIVVPNPANAFSVAAFDACGGTQVACSAVPVDGATNQITFAATGGLSYKIRVAAFPPVLDTDGTFTVQVVLPTALPNDECSGTLPALTVGNPVNGDNTDASTSFAPSDPSLCGAAGPGAAGGLDLFYRFTPATSSAFRIDTCGSAIDSVLAVFSGCPVSDANMIACNDDADDAVACPNSGLNSVIENLNLTAGQTYYIRVAGYGVDAGADTGAFTLLVSEMGSPTTGACCAAGGTCTVVAQANCTGTFQGLGTSCAPNPCPQPNTGACCAAGSCTITTSAQCSGTYQGDNTGCTPNPCPQATGACCAAAGTCSIQTLAACTTAGGTYRGNGTSCLPNPCPQPSGVCCRGATCASAASAGACTGLYTAFFSAPACNAAGNFTTPCCHANYNKVAGVTVQDVFDFLTDWFNGETRANLSNNGNGAPTVQSVFDFLTAWFSGGCS